jgi:DHA1 family bicyclomycin/chloramphenicol resistance-like MFS transporter
MHDKNKTEAGVLKLSIILGALAMFAPVGTDIYITGIVNIADNFHADVSKAQLTLSIYFLGLALGQIMYGPLVDRFGRKRPLLLGIFAFVVSSFLIVVAPSINSVIFLRLIQALGGCSGMIIGRAVVRDLFDYRQSANIYSTLGVVQGLAPILAPIAGGVILARWNWRIAFVFMGLFGLICFALTAFGLPESLPAESRRKVSIPQILKDYYELARHPHFIFPALSGAVAGSYIFAYICASPFVFMNVFGVNKAQYTVIFALNMAGTMLTAHFGNILSKKHSPSWMLMRSMIYALIANGFLVAISKHAPMSFFMIVLWLTIAPLPVIFANSIAIAMRDCLGKAGIASALFGLLQFGFASIVGALVSVWRNGTPSPMAWSMFGAIGIGLAILFVGTKFTDRQTGFIEDEISSTVE